MPKIVSECCEFVKLCHINRIGPTQCSSRWRYTVTVAMSRNTQLYFTKKLVAHNNLKKKRKEKQQYKQDDNH